jgi:hypothetical protein
MYTHLSVENICLSNLLVYLQLNFETVHILLLLKCRIYSNKLVKQIFCTVEVRLHVMGLGLRL